MSALRKETIEFDYGREYLENPKKRRIKSKKKNRIVISGFKNVCMLSATFILGILLVYNYAVITDKQMELNLINKEILQLNNVIDDCQIALEGVKDSNRIEAMAKTYLGMNYPTRKQTIFIDFEYGNSFAEDETSEITKGDNILLGLFDKVIGFIQ